MPSEAYLAAVAKVKAAKAEAQEVAKVAFQEEAIALLDELGADSFTWQQYTPYFNDGDACVFGVYADDPAINHVSEWDGGEEDPPLPADFPRAPKYLSYEQEKELTPEALEEYKAQIAAARAVFKKVADFVFGYEKEDLLFMFGDHAEVTVTKNGIEVEEYMHD